MKSYKVYFALPLILLTLFLSGCSSGPVKKSNILAPTCQDTKIKVTDLQKLGFVPAPGKVVVVRLFRISCPFCKEDLLRIGSMFQTKAWSPENVQLFLIAYKKEGVEDRKTFDAFVRGEFRSLGIPLEAAQIVYVDRDYYSLVKTKSKSGDRVFEGWKAVPFGLVFAKDGRLAYRGHFTTSASTEDQHYDFITRLQSETCP
jgi:hypothetical protein